MTVIVENDDEFIELSDDHAVRVVQLADMFTEMAVKICGETETNLCDFVTHTAPLLVANMIINGHKNCADGVLERVELTIEAMTGHVDGETAH